MKEVLVLGDGASPPAHTGSPNVVHLVTEGAQANVRLQIDIFRTKFLRELPKRFDDLLRIAACIYAADTRISRGSAKDVFGDQWSRHFHFVLPVWDLAFWQQSVIQDHLTDTLQFLTGDTYVFEFVQRSHGTPLQGILQFKELPDPLPRVDVVMLFSGGADSLAAVLEARGEGRQPILVSHRSAPVLASRQKILVEELRKRFPAWAFPHISLWVNRTGGRRTVEFTQRSRSFLFTSLGVVGAALLEIDEVRLCDNGIVSINLPQSGQNIGTLLSRSTHPRFLAQAQEFMRAVTERAHLSIANTLLFKTKKEILDIIAASGYPELLQETMSCAHPENKTRHQPHCGVCSQCIDRRFASEAAGLTAHDLVHRYEKDIFVHPLPEGTAQTHAENYVRFARKLEQMENPDDFFANFPELIECLPMQGDVDAFGQELWHLFQRHQQTVNGVLERKIEAHARAIRQAVLPATCLIRIVSSGQHALDPRIQYVSRLCALLCKSLPAAFQTQAARDERHVQDIGESVLQASQQHLARETPQLPFATIATKPDFSDIPTDEVPLFVEFKYVKERRHLNRMVTEMTSRVTIYRDQGACVLFIVYDPKRTITDDDKFIQAFEKHERIWVGISR